MYVCERGVRHRYERMTKPFIAANWKMHKTVGDAVTFARELVSLCAGINDRDIAIAPPFTALYAVAEILKGSSLLLSAQNMYFRETGAFTGEISPPMLTDLGCDCVILGHSERRTFFGETDEVINKKLIAALSFGLVPVFCIGETLDERTAGKTLEIIARQLTEGLNNIPSDDIERAVIAYEPIWAIGTGQTATAEQAEEVHGYIRDMITDRFGRDTGAAVRIIYGGSVNPDNVAGLMKQPNIRGALVGGASLDVESFINIVRFDK
jgi:triosephosphate isomerase